MSTLRISLFGEMRITHADGSITTNLMHSVQGLLAYLLLLPHRPQPREVLADVFWGERAQERARSCLNTSLWRLRRVLEPEGTPPGTYLITTPNGDIGFNWQSNHWLDVETFEHAVHRVLAQSIEHIPIDEAQQLHAAIEMYTGELLEGFYDDWAVRERERLRQMYLSGLAHLMRFHRQRGSYEQGLAYGRRILNLDPLREEIHREMMQLYAESGQRALAIRQYESCCELLDEELGILPMDETQALYRQMTRGTDHARAMSSNTQGRLNPQHVLTQLRSTLRNLEKAHAQLRQALRLIEQSNDSVEGPDSRLHP